MALRGGFLDGEDAAFGAGVERRLCLRFRLRAKGGSAVVGAGRGLPRRAGRPAGRAAKPHDAPRRRRGAGSAPEGRSACRPCACGKGAFWGGGYACAFWRFCQRR